MRTIKGKTALVTGASSGIGWEIAKELARKGCDLVITARREEKLLELKQAIESEYGVRVLVVALDLAKPGAPESLYNRVLGENFHIDILVNNAGFGKLNPFTDIKWETEKAMLELMVVNLTELTKLYTRAMKERGGGWILMLASTASYQPVPNMASYGAAKSYILNFGLAIREELKGDGISLTVLCPGATGTEFQDRADLEVSGYIKRSMMSAERVAQEGVRAMLKAKAFYTPGLMNKISGWLSRRWPRKIVTRIVSSAMGQNKKR